MRKAVFSFVCDLSLIWAAVLLFSGSNYYVHFLTDECLPFLYLIGGFYTAVSLLNSIRFRKNESYRSRGYNFCEKLALMFRTLFMREKTGRVAVFKSRRERSDFLFILVKLFFIPLMLQFAINNYNDVVSSWRRMSHGDIPSWVYNFNEVWYPLAIAILFLVDTWLFAFGYIFEHPRLRNELRSVDATWLGWLSALCCYPPLNGVVSQFAPLQSSMTVQFSDYEYTFAARVIILTLLIIYVYASVALGAKCSNLTNRGIVYKGPYAVVRHPAYASKVLFWWITIIPVVGSTIWMIPIMLVWTLIYIIRAYTEERHLITDPEYAAYCQQVKYRFIPLIY